MEHQDPIQAMMAEAARAWADGRGRGAEPQRKEQWAFGGRAGDPCEGPPPDRMQVGTRIYVWGYGPTEHGTLGERGVSTWEARCTAVASGWDETRGGAWAKEIILPLGWSEALDAFEIMVGEDATAVGWRLRPIRDR